MNAPLTGLTVPRQYCVAEDIFSGVVKDAGYRCMSVDQALSNTAIPENTTELPACIWLLTADTLRRRVEDIWTWIRDTAGADMEIVVVGGNPDRALYSPLPPSHIHMVVPADSAPDLIRQVVDNAFRMIDLRQDRLRTQSRLALTYQEMRRLTKVGQSLATERDFDTLIALILDQARELVSADSGSIYITERPRAGESATHLRFKKSAMQLEADEFLLPIDKNSIAGYVAFTGEPLLIDDVYALKGSEGYRFNDEFDRTHGYRTRSMMVIPMKNHLSEVIGVIQLINRKRSASLKLTLADMQGEGVLPFLHRSLELASALAGQAAVAVQNNILLQDIHNLFEGFVTASVTAIEQRDPTTSGHSFRVADFTVGLAQAVDRLSDGPFASLRFTAAQMRELRYASLLHDFGKVGVREKVLVKAKKLYEHELEAIRWRFLYAQKVLEKDTLEKKVRHLKDQGNADYAGYERYLDEELAQKLEELSVFVRTIEDSNEPAIVEAGNFERLGQIATRRFHLDDGREIRFLKENELVSLSVRRGNLDQQERLEIESHVTHTYKFLIQIPWTGDLKRIPEIARSHHEKLNGGGYPLGLQGEEISVQTRMMTISDIYDALTAPDRPYKKSLPAEKAIDILKHEAREKHVDGRLLEIFIEAGIFRRHVV